MFHWNFTKTVHLQGICQFRIPDDWKAAQIYTGEDMLTDVHDHHIPNGERGLQGSFQVISLTYINNKQDC